MKTHLQRALAVASSLVILLGAGVATEAAADDEPAWERTIMVPTGDMTLTGISGRAAYLALANVTKSAFLTAITVWEQGDAPCQSEASYWYEHPLSPRNPERTVDWDRQQLRKCSSTPSDNSRRRVAVYGGSRQADGSARAVVGVQVCMNKKRSRVKGVKLLGARISADGTITPSSAYDAKSERPNCQSWEPVRRCGRDRVATGVHLHHTGESLVGIELECRAIEVRQLARR